MSSLATVFLVVASVVGAEEAQQAKKKRSNYVARVTGEGDEDELRKVFNSFVAAKRKVGENVSENAFDNFKAKLGAQSKQIIDSGKGKAVAYRVEVQDGNMENHIKRREDISAQFNDYITRFKELKAEQRAKREKLARERGL